MARLGLKVLIIGFLFWYGLGYLNAATEHVTSLSRVNYLILTFITVTFLGYLLGYGWRSPSTSNPIVVPKYRMGSRSFVSLLFASLTVTALLMASNGRGMLGYHALRAEVAIGILVYISSHLFKGRRRTVLLAIFCTILIYSLGVYSRRPFMTLLAPIILVPLIQKRIKFGWGLPIGLGATAIVSLGLLYITGIRYLGSSAALTDVFPLINKGLSVFLSGQGFDTIHLTNYVVNTYSSKNYLDGETFLGAVLNFIPRGIWPEKPIAFGVTLSAQYYNINLGDTFTNFGPGIIAEAYANGGYFSTIIVAASLGITVGIFDRIVERDRFNWNRVIFACILYPSIFFMVRGDFLNSFYELYSKTLVVYVTTTALRLRSSLRPVRSHNLRSHATENKSQC